MTENDISYKIRGAIFEVYNKLGPGLLENIYALALTHELRSLGLKVDTQITVNAIYKGVKLDLAYRLDMLVEDLVIVEIKSVESLIDLHHKQLLTYLRLCNKKLGLLVNFNTIDISKSIFRKVNGLQE